MITNNSIFFSSKRRGIIWVFSSIFFMPLWMFSCFITVKILKIYSCEDLHTCQMHAKGCWFWNVSLLSEKNNGAKRTEIEPTGFCLWHFLGLKSLVLVYVAGLVSNQGFVKFLGSNLCSVCIKGSPLAQCALGNSVVLKSVVESSLSLWWKISEG